MRKYPLDTKRGDVIDMAKAKPKQARKVLMAATRLQTLADAGKTDLNRSLEPFEKLASQWQSVAKQLRDYQSERRWLERWLNSSAAMPVAVALGVPVVCWLLFLIVR